MKKLIAIVFGLVIGLTVSYDTYASHLAGGSIRYDYVGPTPGSTTSWRYKITVFAFRYCGSGNTATYSCGTRPEEVYARCTQSGAQLGPIRLTQVPYVAKPGDRPNPRQARDVSDVCTNKQTGCEVRGGVNGYELFVWEGTVDLPRCNSLSKSAENLLEGETNLISSLANISALIHSTWNDVSFWCGFYLIQNNQLELGPFQGPIACTTIQYGKGVCGNAWKTSQSIIVNNVHEYEGHIACSSQSNSEIVIPIIANNEVVGILDIDSEKFDAFNSKHQQELELICNTIAIQFFS
jgi:GAF domain-containing protein